MNVEDFVVCSAEPEYEEEEASDSFPAFYQGGDFDDYERSISMIRTEDGCREDE